MAWVTVGATSASMGVWKTVGQIHSDLIRVSYTMPVPSRPPLGVLRQKWDTNTFDGHWLKIYPKPVDMEIHQLPVPPPFLESGIYERQLQVRAWSNWPWSITVEEWL